MAEARNNNQTYIRRGWYEARTGSTNSRIVYIDSQRGYQSARQALGIAPHWVGASLDNLINEQENSTVIAPDDWEENPRRYGIGSRSPDTTEEREFGSTGRYKRWKKRRDNQQNKQRRTRPPGSGSHYGMARSSMAQHMYPYQGNIHYDMNTQRQFNIPGHLGGIGMMPNPYRI